MIRRVEFILLIESLEILTVLGVRFPSKSWFAIDQGTGIEGSKEPFVWVDNKTVGSFNPLVQVLVAGGEDAG